MEALTAGAAGEEQVEMRWRKLDRRACTTLLLARRSHVLGEVMLLASRLERECHVYGVPILMGEGTAPVSSDRYPRVAPDFSWRTGRSGLRRGMGAEDLHDGTSVHAVRWGKLQERPSPRANRPS